jgi:hypothetical protein
MPGSVYGFVLGSDDNVKDFTEAPDTLALGSMAVGEVEDMEVTLSRSLDALLPIKLPTLKPQEEIELAALEAVFSLVVFTEVVDVTDATEAKLRGRSLGSPPFTPCGGGENEDGGGGGELTSEEGAGDALGVLAPKFANGLPNVNPGDPVELELEDVCRWATILLTPPRTPSTALKKPVEPAEMALDSTSFVGPSCCSMCKSERPSWRRRPISETRFGRASHGCLG